jgi:hypothetical protein
VAADRKRLDTLLVNGKPLPCPDENVVISENDLDSDDTGRDEGGYMHRLVLRPAVKTWEFPYGYLSASDYDYIRSLVSEPIFSVDFWGVSTIAYCSNNSVTMRNALTGDYRNFTLKIIEC